MTQRVVIITGASRGIGRAVSRWLAGPDTAVVLVARSGPTLASAVADVEAAGGRALAIRVDLADHGVGAHVVTATMERFGRVDAVVNNAAVIEPVARVADVDLDAWLGVIRLNLLGPLAISQAALANLAAVGGRIVNVVTIAATMPIPALSAYASSKAALVQLTKVLALEEPSVTTLALDPGPTDSDMMDALRMGAQRTMPPEWSARYERMQRDEILNPPELPARSIAWLALHAPPSMSGQLVHFDQPDVAEASQRTFGGEPLPVAPIPPPPTAGAGCVAT